MYSSLLSVIAREYYYFYLYRHLSFHRRRNVSLFSTYMSTETVNLIDVICHHHRVVFSHSYAFNDTIKCVNIFVHTDRRVIYILCYKTDLLFATNILEKVSVCNRISMSVIITRNTCCLVYICNLDVYPHRIDLLCFHITSLFMVWRMSVVCSPHCFSLQTYFECGSIFF